jgi:hypothetical protein
LFSIIGKKFYLAMLCKRNTLHSFEDVLTAYKH